MSAWVSVCLSKFHQTEIFDRNGFIIAAKGRSRFNKKPTKNKLVKNSKKTRTFLAIFASCLSVWKSVQHCIKIHVSFHFSFFCCWYEERVQRVFHVIKVNRAEVCIYCRKHKLLHIKLYTQTYRSIRRKKSKHTKKHHRSLPLTNGRRCCRYCVSTLPLLLLLRFFIIIFFSFFVDVANVYFSRLPFCFDDILIYRDWTVIGSFHLKCSHVYRMQNVIIAEIIKIKSNVAARHRATAMKNSIWIYIWLGRKR